MKTQRIIYLTLSMCIALGINYSKESLNIHNAIFAEVKKCPKLEIQDLYKLAYQAAMGNEHIMTDTVEVRQYLEDELTSADSSASEPLIEYLTSDSSIARVNLRPFKAQKGNPTQLLTVMLKTASMIQPSTKLLHQFWGEVETLAEKGKIPFKKEELSNYFRDMEQQNFPPVHHSKIFENTCHPAYRIVAGKQIPIQ